MNVSAKKYLDEILKDNNISTAIDESILSVITDIVTKGEAKTDGRDVSKLIRLSSILINYVFNGYIKGELPSKNITKTTALLLTSLKVENDDENAEYFNEILGVEALSIEEVYYFYLAVLGLLSKDTIRTQLDLKNYAVNLDYSNLSWDLKVLSGCINAFILLVRKDNGFQDINSALQIIKTLKKEQAIFENNYLNSIKDESEKLVEAYKLVGIYHLSKIIVETATYLVEGYSYKQNLSNVIKLHKNQAINILDNSSKLSSLANIIFIGCTELYRNSIWFNTENLGTDIEKLCRKLSERSFIDLLPSQKEALEKNLLDTASNVTIIQMPTSAGKTLLAEFTILQTLALKRNSKVVYVVPTRALMNQIYFDLKKDLAEFNYIIEKTSKVNEIDPAEDTFLRDDIDILITTPEKLDLLIRRDHPAVADLSLIVIDEAHNIKDGERGARLELLLVILKRERSKARFLLLSPFLKNAEDISKWLAEGKNAIPPIKIDWKPSEKVIAGLRKKKNTFSLELIPSAHGFEYVKKPESFEINQNIKIKSSGVKNQMFELASKSLADTDRCNLYLCWGPRTSDTRAKDIADNISDNNETELTSLVSRFVEDEVGAPTILSDILKKRVAVHHSGLTDETKLLIEFLIREKQITHVCATTTIAQGINFPISSVYIDDLRKGRDGNLDINDLLNIAGRAGRTMVDRYGKVFFPFNTDAAEEKVRNLIMREASEVTSALTEIVYKSEELLHTFSEKDSSARREAFRNNESLGAFIQYLVHLLNVIQKEDSITEIESFFKDSLGYYTLKNEEQRSSFIKLCHALFSDLQSKEYKGALKYADKTGFSVPSVLSIMHSSKDNVLVSSLDSWRPDVLFNENSESLTEKISVIAKLREVKLGTDSDEAKFNPKIIARILINWVNGEKINNISALHPAFINSKDRLNKFVKYMNSLTFKSSWGLSALEGICLSKDADVAKNSFIPSMVYYGVNSSKAVSTRMIGVPRTIADNVSSLINEQGKVTSYAQLRANLHGLTSSDWETVVPKNSKLNADEWKTITNVLVN